MEVAVAVRAQADLIYLTLLKIINFEREKCKYENCVKSK